MKKLMLAACMLSMSGTAFAITEVTASTETLGAQSVISSWPPTSQGVAKVMIEKYGQPNEFTASMLLWRNSGNWKRIIVHRDAIPHNFPQPHSDVLEQVVDYKVPAGKFSDLARFDGSVAAHRTKGELSAMCDKEEMNHLALNLARDIIEGKKSVDEARRFYAQTVKTSMAGKESEYTKDLLFKPAFGDSADPDKNAPEFK